MANEELIQIIKRSPHYLYKKLVRDLTIDLGLTVEQDFDNWIYVNNSSPICLVAHIDTIDRDEKLKLKINRNVIKANDSVLGADDRAGVYAIMTLLRKCKAKNVPMPSVIFTNYEETGCKGAKKFCEDNKFKKEGCNFFIELDRKGSVDYVYYSDELPNEVEEYIESFGFIKSHGSCSDVEYLTKTYKIPHVNVSVGYYSQHTKFERLHIDELELTIARVFKIIRNPIDTLYEIKEKKKYGRNNINTWRNNKWVNNQYDNDYSDSYGYDYNNGINNLNLINKGKKKAGMTAKVYVLNRNKMEIEEIEAGKIIPKDIVINTELTKLDEHDKYNPKSSWEQTAFIGV